MTGRTNMGKGSLGQDYKFVVLAHKQSPGNTNFCLISNIVLSKSNSCMKPLKSELFFVVMKLVVNKRSQLGNHQCFYAAAQENEQTRRRTERELLRRLFIARSRGTRSIEVTDGRNRTKLDLPKDFH